MQAVQILENQLIAKLKTPIDKKTIKQKKNYTNGVMEEKIFATNVYSK